MISPEPNLKKLAISQMSARHAASNSTAGSAQRLSPGLLDTLWAVARHRRQTAEHRPCDRKRRWRVFVSAMNRYGNLLRHPAGDFGCSTKFRTKVENKLFPALRATGILMFWVLATWCRSRC
jgi:peptide/nickel transport system permease protein